MLRFLLSRVSLILPTFIGVTFLAFILIRLVPGDPIEARVGEHGISDERLAELRHEFGYDQPLWKQFLDYELQVVKGDLGVSVVTRESVWKEFVTLFPATVELSVAAIKASGVAHEFRTTALRSRKRCRIPKNPPAA